MASKPHGTGPDGLEAEGGRSATGRSGGSGRGASDAVEPGTGGPVSGRPTGTQANQRNTRLGMIWTSVVIALILLVLLIIFIAQNQDQVLLRYFGFEGQVGLGLALFIAAVAGGIVVAAAGAARIIQLRLRDRKTRGSVRP
ncbi:lipopolysaccharide assembly protein LapA domain-containing protein [Arthrobacter sulfonylureivorans]|uniref:lipopolysaccharide assembly protein LapA domain-containing protein n=1 Tax=Arthrobacter sulfonylureivorans TaxID=2486855 RepID=UPI0039E721BF